MQESSKIGRHQHVQKRQSTRDGVATQEMSTPSNTCAGRVLSAATNQVPTQHDVSTLIGGYPYAQQCGTAWECNGREITYDD